MITAVDSNVLFDVLLPDPVFANASQQLLEEADRHGSLVISEIVYAELAARFPEPADLDTFLADTRIRLVPSRPAALQWAARAWKSYLTSRSGGLQCPACGRRELLACTDCGTAIVPRQHILSDFIIGGHALTQADRLISRDLGYYRSHFPRLKLMSPG